MSLQDEHLKQALKHAPDNDLAPSDAARAAVMAYANQALKVKQVSLAARIGNWLQEWFGPSWHSVGLGSAVATVLIVVVVWHEQPNDTIWQVSKPIEESAYQSEDSVVAPAPQAASIEPQTEVTAATPSPIERRPVDKSEAQNMTSASKSTSAAPAPASTMLASKDDQEIRENSELAEAIPQVPSPIASAPTSTPAPMVQDSAVSAQAELAKEAPSKAQAGSTIAKDNLETKKLAAKPEARSLAMPKSAEKMQITETVLVRIKNSGGKTAANQDIQAGNVRLIQLEMRKVNSDTLDCPQIQNQALSIDATTGFRIESIAICETSDSLQSAVEIYNQTMRDWQSGHLK